MMKSFSGQVAFCFAILRAISAYVGENWLSQYIDSRPKGRRFEHRSLKFGPYIAYIASKPKAHGVIT